MGATQGMQFEQQPSVGGLGMGMVGQGQYYGQNMVGRASFGLEDDEQDFGSPGERCLTACPQG